MSTFEIHECPNPSQPLGLGSSEGLGAWLPTAERMPAPETDVLALVVFGATARMTVAGHFQACADGPWGWYSYEQPEIDAMRRGE